MVDAEATLAQFIIESDLPNASRFRNAVTPFVEQACSRGPQDLRQIRARGGDDKHTCRRTEHTVAAVRLKTLWNQLARSHAFALLCGYWMGHFYQDTAHQEICDLSIPTSRRIRASDSATVH